MEHMVSIILKACRFTDMLLKANYFEMVRWGREKEQNGLFS